jgi:hypothetical protein
MKTRSLMLSVVCGSLVLLVGGELLNQAAIGV